ncbi:MAG: FixH family protein [Chloroflexi bacterium]|nr:FixH family protein [Chloroflexota bacterium]
MSTLRFTGKALAALAFLAASAVIAAACSGGGGDGGDSAAITEVTPVIVNSELAVGENRFMVGLLSSENEEIVGATVAFRFFKLDGDQQELREEAQATPITLEKSYTHTHEDGTVETHEAGESGVYVATVRFDEPGQWRVEVTATVGVVTHDPADAGFDVLEESASVAMGAPAPLSETLTLDDVEDVAEIDTSNPPIPEMHTMTIAEAVTSGRPSVIVFATPAFCLSRICGPTKDIVDALFKQYKGEVNFVHVEPYELDRARSGEGLFAVPATTEWGLTSEPWVFLVDSEGNIAAKFEAVVVMGELTEALTPLLDDGDTDSGSGIGY